MTDGNTYITYIPTYLHLCIKYTETQPPTYAVAWPVRILLPYTNCTKLLGEALALKKSILRPKIAHVPNQPPYTQDTVRDYKG
jgi:hypothetical protein